ncbi:MAG: Gfo/Idh/MocA family oxidoreductase [Lachnospiraceae bacterium]|jgi:predicted dehydrogenase|nr:Gfo/Idh/MocA family oxidoreductase [Lachnospiraceae bacterium]
MKICIVGLGSIGKRHVRNIRNVLKERQIEFTLDALRIKGTAADREIEEIISETYRSFEELPDDYNIIFITNPTSLHYDTVRMLIGKTQHMFIEKPVFDRYRDINAINLSADGIYYVACPLRHKKVIAYIKNLVDQGEHFYSIRAISSSYLPDWRKGIDYRNVYSAKKELGGGVELDLIHEWDYLTYLFGIPEQMYKFVSHCSSLEINSDDLAVYIAKYQDKAAELHLDYFGVETVRRLELIGNRKNYIVDLLRNVIQIISINNDENKYIDFGEDDFYLSEMNYFFDSVSHNEKTFNEIDRANDLMKFVLEEPS